MIFQSTLSVRRATRVEGQGVVEKGFQSTLSVRRATDEAFGTRVYFDISIHALREESDSLRICISAI